MFIIKVIDLSTKDKKYKHQKYRPLEIEKKVFFSYFISEIPHFSYKCFFRKCSMFCGSIPLISCHVDMSFIKQTGQNNKILLLSRSYIKRFVWYNLHDSQSALRFSLCLHYHTSCSYWVVKFVHTAYSIFRSLNAMSEKQAAAAIIIALIWKKKRKRKKGNQGKKEKSGWNLGLKVGKAWEYMKLCSQDCSWKMNVITKTICGWLQKILKKSFS